MLLLNEISVSYVYLNIGFTIFGTFLRPLLPLRDLFVGVALRDVLSVVDVLPMLDVSS